MKKTITEQPVEETEEENYTLIYNIYITNLTINVADGGKVYMQRGKPVNPPHPPNG